MSADEADENTFYGKFYDDYQSIMISLYIKDIMLIANIIGGGKIFSYLRKIFPLSLLGYVVPTLQCSNAILESSLPGSS